jgi:hypothetical protein
MWRYFVLKTLLCLVILLIASQNNVTWNYSIGLLPDAWAVPEKAETKNENPPVTTPAKESMPVGSSHLIPEKNIFNPERRDFPTPHLGKSNPILRPQIILYGVTIAGDYQSATVINPGRPLRKDEREAFTIKIGERIGEYKLAKIFPDRILMESNGDNFEVLLCDPKNPKRRIEVRPETKPSIIASPQSNPALSSGEATKPASPQAQVAASLPFNKYTYQLLGPSAVIGRGRIFSPPPGTSAQ